MMYPQELIPPDLELLRERGEVRRVAHGPSTVGEVLERARASMDEQDRLEELERDPLAFLAAHRPRTLLNRLLGRI